MRKMRLPLWLSICCLLLAAFVPRADAVTYYFDTSNAFGSWTGAIPPGYGYVEVTQGENDWLYFQVGANSSYFEGSGPGLSWDKFYLNLGDAVDVNDIEILVEAGDWSIVQDRNVSEFGRFDLGLVGTSFGDAANDPLNFVIRDSSLDIEDFTGANEDGWLFAAHLRRFESIDGNTSTFLGVSAPGTSPAPAPVPEPGTILLIGTGLAGMALRRKKNA